MPLLYEKRGHVAVLTLSRPQARNAWGEDYNEALKEMLPRLEDDAEIRVCRPDRRRGGRGFSAGADLKNPKTHPVTRSPMRSRHCRSGGGIRR